MNEKRAQAIKRLINCLGSEDNETVLSAGAALLAIGKPAVPFLVDALSNENWRTRMNASAVLGKIGPPACAAVKKLTELLSDENAGVRYAAAWALGHVGEKAVPKLVSELKYGDVRSKGNAAKSLAEMGERALVALIRAITLGALSYAEAKQAMDAIRFRLLEKGFSTGMRVPVYSETGWQARGLHARR